MSAIRTTRRSQQPPLPPGAQYVVSHNTHNTHDFPPLPAGRHVYADIEYVTTIEFIEDVLGERGADILGAPLPEGSAVRSRRTPHPA